MTILPNADAISLDVHMAVLIAEEQQEPVDRHLRSALQDFGGVFLFSLPCDHGTRPAVAAFLVHGDPEPQIVFADFRDDDEVCILTDKEAPKAWYSFARAHLEMMVHLGTDAALLAPMHATSQ